MWPDDDFPRSQHPVAEDKPLYSNVALGVTLGQHRNPPALAIVEADWRRRETDASEWCQHFTVRHLKQFEAKTTYPAIAEYLREISERLVERDPRWSLQTFVDTTGLGEPVFTLLREKVPKLGLLQVTFNHGDQRLEVDDEIRLGKAYLVTRLQTLLQTDRLHLGRHPQSDRLVKELLDYQLETSDNGNDTYGAFQVGTRDQLVTSLGLAVNTTQRCEAPEPPPPPETWLQRRQRRARAREHYYWRTRGHL